MICGAIAENARQSGNTYTDKCERIMEKEEARSSLVAASGRRASVRVLVMYEEKQNEERTGQAWFRNTTFMYLDYILSSETLVSTD